MRGFWGHQKGIPKNLGGWGGLDTAQRGNPRISKGSQEVWERDSGVLQGTRGIWGGSKQIWESLAMSPRIYRRSPKIWEVLRGLGWAQGI